MKVILLQNLKSLGQIGDIKDVSDGYARNFLIPKKMAEVATEEAVKRAEAKKSQEQAEKEADLNELKTLAEKINGKKIILKSKEKGGKLFGSIAAKDIASALKREGLEISEKSIIIKKAIKKVGRYKIEIILDKGIQSKINLAVESEK